MDKPKIKIHFEGEQGNIFYIVSEARMSLDELSAQRMMNRVLVAKSYKDALNIIGEYVTIIPL